MKRNVDAATPSPRYPAPTGSTPTHTGGETGDETRQTKSINFFQHGGDVVDDDADDDDGGGHVDGDDRSKLKIVNFPNLLFQKLYFSIASLEFPD